ncbi:iron-regulated protein [Chromobacterium sp. ATCC 53434]|uniref:ChaN family lipoprotein n=1 Tax=Chromobacterium sp. (strain ATCC 53434 / SC 14030) TaxID=2059672 RepID=UPI000C75E557|nr:ChaN family lipoprotein [Chromobacterium sp. ATCC 53434]AUH49566.1 iron-regulated protein [Chromobacterium sp. ATCC 53434]
MRRWMAAIALLAGLSACATQPAARPEGAPAGRIVETAGGGTLSPEQLLARLAPADMLLLGEKHDNRHHHRIEVWLARGLAASRPQGSALLEMLTPSQQPRVDEVKAWLQGDPAVRPSRVQELVAWQAGWPWALYGELAMTLLRAPYPLLAANLDRDQMRAYYLSRERPQGRATRDPRAASRLEEVIRSEHGGKMDDGMMASMLAVQQQRDRRMAERLLAAPKPALLIAGAYHVRRDVGVPLHLADLAPGRSAAVLVLAEEGAGLGREQADYVWYTAADGE